MPERYFEKFNTITYANAQVVDITERVVFTENTLKNPYVYYLDDINNETRPDQYAADYYGDSYYSWLLYLANKTIDPYYDWYMSDSVFNDFIDKKYGSGDIAQAKTYFYRNNWPNADVISASEYDALPATLLHYWEPQYALNGSILNYARKQEDTVINTNNIVVYPVANTNFVNNEIVQVYFDINTTGQGQVLFANNGYLYIQHTSGYTVGNELNVTANTAGINTAAAMIFFANADMFFDVNEQIYYEVPTGNTAIASLTGNSYYYIASVNSSGFTLSLTLGGSLVGLTDVRTNSPAEQHIIIPSYVKANAEIAYITSNSYVYGTESGVNTSITSSVLYSSNLLPEEQSYFSPVNYYDYEREKNEANKSIKVVQSQYASKVANSLKGLLK